MLINWQSRIKKIQNSAKIFSSFWIGVLFDTPRQKSWQHCWAQCRSSVTVRPICNTRVPFYDKDKKDSTWGILLPATTIWKMAET